MYTVMVTAEGQVTIPNQIRHQLGIQRGGPVSFDIHGSTVVLRPVIDDIRAAFGLLKANQSVSLADMDKAIEQTAMEQYDQS